MSTSAGPGRTEPRWLGTEEQRTWRDFLTATQWLLASVDGQLQRDAGMPLAYYEILVRLSEAADRSLRMTQLAAASASSKSRVSHAVARLEERGWVRRTDCPTDRRGQIAQLTDAGYAALSAAAPGHVEHVRRVLIDPLSAGQLRQLAAISAAILAAAHDAPADGDCQAALSELAGQAPAPGTA
ncbi:MAG TPA: MarR family transcriptional regulator [Streptosporangiaceae bacterium]|nr:MarR family transcriptional regulator [Streptosporangiaceae bacterium]